MTAEKSRNLVEKFKADLSEEQTEELQNSLENVSDEKYENLSKHKTKSVKTTTLLSAFLGLFGAGSFYLGLIKRGIVKIVCNVLVPLILACVFFVWLSPMHLKYADQSYAISSYSIKYSEGDLQSAVNAYDSSASSNNSSAYKQLLDSLDSVSGYGATLGKNADDLDANIKYTENLLVKVGTFRTSASLQTLSQSFSELSTILADVKEGETLKSSGLASAELKAAVTAAVSDSSVSAETKTLLNSFLTKLNRLSNVTTYNKLASWNENVQALEQISFTTLKASLADGADKAATFAEGCADGQYYLDNYESFSTAMTQANGQYAECAANLALLQITVGAEDSVTITFASDIDGVLSGMKGVFTLTDADKGKGEKSIGELATEIQNALDEISEPVQAVTNLKTCLTTFSSKLASDAPESKIDSCISGVSTAKTALKTLNETKITAVGDTEGVDASKLVEDIYAIMQTSATAAENAASTATSAKTNVDTLLGYRSVASLTTTYENYLATYHNDKAVEDKTGFTARLTESVASLKKIQTSTNFAEIQTELNKTLRNVNFIISGSADGYFDWTVSGKWEFAFPLTLLIIDGITIISYWINEVFQERKKCRDYNYKQIQTLI